MKSRDAIKEDAEFYRLGCITQYISQQQVIAWADRIIAQSDRPSSEIIDVSIASGMNDLIAKLARVQGEYDWNRVLQRFFRLLYDVLCHAPDQAETVAHTLYALMFECQHELSSTIEQAIYYFDDGFDLANQKICGDIQGLTNELLAFLEAASVEAASVEAASSNKPLAA